MHGDFSRLQFDSGGRLYTRVRQLQGRLALDADWNTHVELQQRLDAQTRVDVIGECGYPDGGTGLKVTVAPGAPTTDFLLGKGRFYANGLVLDLPADVRYSQQPFRRRPVALAPPAGGAGKQVVYLEVWERHVTAVEDPTILEPALDGRDTASRVQTVWQVKVAAAGAADTCQTTAAPAVGPGTGTLTTSAVTPPPTADPCLIDPKGGFRGLDNRLYRVEVHAGGALGAATFKWSRDNGSVVYPLAAPPTAGAGVVSAKVPVPPRDELLALHGGEWVELLDDETDFEGGPGPLLKLKQDPEPGPDGVKLTLEAPGAVALPTGANLKVRRWDGKGGAVATAAGPLDLEDGVRVAFGPGSYKVGDYWTFTARANGAAVQPLTAAPPQGVRRFACKLAVLTWAGGAVTNVEDCRKAFPPLTNLPKAGNRGCCTITVGDGKTSTGDFDSLADAVKKAHEAIGPVRVCLLPGTHAVPVPVEITRRDPGGFWLAGCGTQARVEGKGRVLVVRGATDVVLENLLVAGDLPVAVLATTGDAPVAAERVTVRRCRLDGGEWALLAQALRLEVVENDCTGGIGVGESSRDVRVEGNQVVGGSFGVGLGRPAVKMLDPLARSPGIERVVVCGNAIRGARFIGVGAPADLPRSEDPLTPAVTDLDVRGNRVSECGREVFNGWPAAGIAIGRAARVRVADNDVRDCGRARDEGGKVTELAPACGVFVAEVGHIEVTGNTVVGNGLTVVVQELNFADANRFPERTFAALEPFVAPGVRIAGFAGPAAPGAAAVRVGPMPGAPAVRGAYSTHQLAFNFTGASLPEFVAVTVSPILRTNPANAARVIIQKPGGATVAQQDFALDGRSRTVSAAAVPDRLGGAFVISDGNAGAGVVIDQIGAPVLAERVVFGRSAIQGAIVVLGAVGGLPTVPVGKVPTRFGGLLVEPGAAAARVTGNRAICPQGPALLLTGAGPATVAGNTLVSTGTYTWADAAVAPFATSGANLASLSDSAVAVGLLRASDMEPLLFFLNSDGRLSVEGNQVSLDATAQGEHVEDGCVFQWAGDIGVTNNQFLARTSTALGIHVRVGAVSPASAVRVIGNRVTEVTPNDRQVSIRVDGIQSENLFLPPAVVALNQTSNAIEVGTARLKSAPSPVDLGNQRA